MLTTPIAKYIKYMLHFQVPNCIYKRNNNSNMNPNPNNISPSQPKPSTTTTMSTFQTTTTTAATAATAVPFHNNIIHNHKRRAKTPSFSSVLLDAIYQSIDDSCTNTNIDTDTPKAVTTNHNNDRVEYDCVMQNSKQRRDKMRSDSNTLETINLRHAIMIDSWIDKQPPPPPPPKQPQPKGGYYCYYNQNVNHHNKLKLLRQKSVSYRSGSNIGSSSTSSPSSCFTHPKRETSSRIFNKTKLKALKIYSDLKKSKQQRRQQQQQQQQPVSPGARIAAFLNSIFRNGNNGGVRSPTGKPPITTVSISTSTCSSVSSFSRSCLSKTTTSSSTEKSNRSVRFYPVNTVIVDDSKSSKLGSDHLRYNNKKLKMEDGIESMMSLINRNRINNNNDYKEVLKFEMCSDEEPMKIDDDEDEDDDESCASSDLFELENLSSIGVSSFTQELPVYGTTSLRNLIS